MQRAQLLKDDIVRQFFKRRNLVDNAHGCNPHKH
jgi:hypothetical protein